MMTLGRLIFSLLITLNPHLAHASEISATNLSLLWCIPFAGILLSIAIFPLLMPGFWHKHYGKITCVWGLLFFVPFLINFGFEASFHLLSHAIFSEFIPFILLLLSLFIVSGGILIQANLRGRPKLNVILLLIGTILASIMGTTGASMLLIRPLIKANRSRKHKVHIIVFFIFLVANIGGGLTPLGDPPLFLGFLHGVHFFWVTRHMFLPILICSTLLLIIFYIIDNHYFRQEILEQVSVKTENNTIRLRGKRNLLLLISIILTILLSGICKSTMTITFFKVTLSLSDMVRDILLILISITSMVITPKQIRSSNQFSWEPIIEVAKLFLGIFITIFPLLTILRAGSEGAFSSVISLVHNHQHEPVNRMYFWLTGLLSAFLDNAPTYLIFFNLADGNASVLMDSLSGTLLAISMGSVFMGAFTYIGNAPNFMIKSIAAQQHIIMPSFFGYIKWSVTILLPIFLIITLLFF